MPELLYFGTGLVLAIVGMIAAGRAEFFDDDDDFFLYAMTWVLRLLFGVIIVIGWPVILAGTILIFLAWLPWAKKQQKKHVKRWGYEDEDYDWHKFLPERYRKEKQDQY